MSNYYTLILIAILAIVSIVIFAAKLHYDRKAALYCTARGMEWTMVYNTYLCQDAEGRLYKPVGTP